jgi:glycosidase
MHARKPARDAYFPSRTDDAFFTPRGDIAFVDSAAARRFAERVNAADRRSGEAMLRPAEIAAMVLVHEIMHAVIGLHRQRHPESFGRLGQTLSSTLGDGHRNTLLAFLNAFPTPAIYKRLQGEGENPSPRTPEEAGTAEKLLEVGGQRSEDEYTEEVILLWLTNQNPAYEPVRPIVTDRDLPETYRAFVDQTRSFLESEPSIGPGGENLFDLLLEPVRRSPTSIFGQLRFIEENWGTSLGLDQLGVWRRLLWARDLLHEEGRYFSRGGPGPGEPLLDAMRFGSPEAEPKRFSADLDWMPRVVLIAKTVYVWLDQLSKAYGRPIERLDQVPDEELDRLASRGFTGLWLIGLFERSAASRKVKQMRGDQEAVASAYSLKSYDVAAELGGYGAYESLRDRAWARGLRLAADMVPNHVGIDADWVMKHPHWFIQTPHPPFPSYRFGGADLSDNPDVGIFIEEGYWNHTDASVVFRRHDRRTGDDRFLYHGNDGTSMPWNDTAQLDYTKAEVRQAAIETILHVARMFPIIRFDAAMTLAKKHFKRLWFPFPGAGDGIPSRADYAMTQEEFDRVFPVEFWREVVDTVAQRAPDTLLLAEAFWMMEGYFVRSLGMHRVYNSAFMNMLKREENAKYRETIKNVLDFDPEILKRFVNFMNNPDEETAVAQFGTDDKYFGVCMLMSTMPGLPMFGHGQVEGFHEKYGMEYRRAKWDERPNEGLVARHEREIFPILKKRYLFSGVASFALYDFMAEGGGVDDDVYAFTNGMGDERALVLYNNKWKTTRGRIHHSLQSRREDGSLQNTDVKEALGLSPSQGDWVVFRDVPNGLDYIRPMREITGGGFFWELHAFKYHVFLGFRPVHATPTRPYDRLAAELAGRGVPSMERAVTDLHYRPVHVPLREMLSQGHLAYLASGWDTKARAPKKEALFALSERLGHLADGVEYMTGKKLSRTEALSRAEERYAAVLRMAHAPSPYATDGGASAAAAGKAARTPPPAEATKTAEAATTAEATTTAKAATTAATKDGAREGDLKEAKVAPPETPGPGSAPPKSDADEAIDVAQLLAWVQVEAALDLLATLDPDAARSSLVDGWELALPVLDAFCQAHSEHDAKRRSALVLIAATVPSAPLREALRASLTDARARTYLNVHEAGGVEWLVKERFAELARWLGDRETALGHGSLALSRRQAEDAARVAEKEGFRAQRIEKALAGDALLAPEPR